MTITFDAARFLRRAICRWKGRNVKNSFMALSHFCQNLPKLMPPPEIQFLWKKEKGKKKYYESRALVRGYDS